MDLQINSLPDNRLTTLLEKGRDAQRQAIADFDWQARPGLPFWLPKKLAASAVSQFHYGEITTARMCRQILPFIAHGPAREFLETQALDEDRHSSIYLTYLEKIGGIAPISKDLQACYEEALSWKGAPEAIMVAFHIILEGEALRLSHDIDMWMPCPLFQDLSTVIARDEARHVAFGKIYLKQALPTLPKQERLEIYIWARALWYKAATSVAGRFSPPGLFGMSERFRNWLTRKWLERLDDLEGAGLFTAAERNEFIEADRS